MSEYVVKIEKLTNGYEVEYRDPDIVKANRAPTPKGGMSKPWRDPSRAMAFTTAKEVADFLSKNLDKMVADADYETSFSNALMEPENDD